MRTIFKQAAIALAVALAIGACSNNNKDTDPDNTVIDVQPQIKGDSTIYGLACDGCTDSVIVFLRNSGGDPDTFDIIDARQEHHIYGRPRIGDRLAVLLDKNDSAEARIVIDLDDLQGKWCYMATPKLRDLASLPPREQRRMMANIPDSVKETWLVPKEFGFQIRRGNTARPIGVFQRSNTTDDMSPVEYPPFKMYTEWHIFNGKLILTEEHMTMPGGNKAPKSISDTADIMMLGPDTLVLKFKDETKGYYRQK